MALPQSMPLPIRKTANQRKVLRIVKLLAPNAFKIPIILVRSMIIISKPEIMVNRLNGWQPEQVTGVELQVKDYDKLEDITYEIATDIDNRQDDLGGVYYVRNIEQLNPQIFAWLDLLDLNVWVILILMIGVAGFTMISGLLIIIIERTNQHQYRSKQSTQINQDKK